MPPTRMLFENAFSLLYLFSCMVPTEIFRLLLLLLFTVPDLFYDCRFCYLNTAVLVTQKFTVFFRFYLLADCVYLL